MANLGQRKSTDRGGLWLNLVRAGGVCCVESRKYCEEFELWLAGCRYISTFKLGAGRSFGLRNEEAEGLLGSCGDLKHLKR